MPLYIKNSSSVIKYFHFYYNAQIYLYDNTSFDKRKHLFRNREQKIFVIFYPTAQKELLHISMRSPFLLRNEYSKWPVIILLHQTLPADHRGYRRYFLYRWKDGWCSGKFPVLSVLPLSAVHE